MVTYYGKHYSSYLYNTHLGQWIYLDDATVRVLGTSWQLVVDKCIKGHFQPLLLIYSNPNGTVVNTQHALKNTVPMNSPVKPSSTRNMPPPPIAVECVDPSLMSYDVPDSPSTSIASCFSDVCDSADDQQYINRQSVERIMRKQAKATYSRFDSNAQILSRRNRYSNSSLESFDQPTTIDRNHLKLVQASLQRHDSGSSGSSGGGGSGGRASSVSSGEASTVNFKKSNSNTPQVSGYAMRKQQHGSDQGYDTYSISSNDSYPVSNSSSQSSPSRKNNRLKQIPEDVRSITESSDQLFAEIDILLFKSHEKEEEGDLRGAAALSESAASKARQAMDTPYSNEQILISAKMKHSMCVMRSTSLHKRIQEKEAEEKRQMRASQEYIHVRQSSRESTHSIPSRHSRQNSRDSKEAKSVGKQAEVINKQATATLEIYATLPKKGKGKKHAPKMPTTGQNTLLLEIEKLKNAKKVSMHQESDFSDYYSEWDGLQRQHHLSAMHNSSESGGAALDGTVSRKKQYKVKRKLLFNNLLKTKNRSMPELCENECKNDKQENSNVPESCMIVPKTSSCSVANIQARGFHQAHKSFVCEQGVHVTTSLVKVAPPLIQQYANKPQAAAAAIPFAKSSDHSSKSMDQQIVLDVEPDVGLIEANNVNDPFFRELNQKRLEILGKKDVRASKPLPAIPPRPQKMVTQGKPSSVKIANFICQNNVRLCPPPSVPAMTGSGKIHAPIPVHAQRPPDYETTMKRLTTQQGAPHKPFNMSMPSTSHHKMTTGPEGRHAQQSTSLAMPAANQNKPATRRSSQRKSVKFSDDIQLIACDEDFEEHLPNPLMEKVLSNKNFTYTF